MLCINQGVKKRAQKVVIYGCEGIGKSTLASQFPDPLFIDTEGGTSHMDVKRTQVPASFEELCSLVNEVASMRGSACKTLVIDTADWAEQMLIANICEEFQKKSIEEFGYGKGYTYLMERFNKLLKACDNVIASGVNVVITAHAKMRKFEQPDEIGSYDRWEMKLTQKVAPMVKEWSDMLLFLSYKTYVIHTQDGMEKKAKAQGGKRVMYTNHHPCWDAKNRHGLPDEMELSYKSIEHLFKDNTEFETTEQQQHHAELIAQLGELMAASSFTDRELKCVVGGKGYFPYSVDPIDYPTDFIEEWVIPNWENIVKFYNENK